MSGLACHSHINIVQFRSSVGDFANVATNVKAIAKIRFNPAFIHIHHAKTANFFTNGKAQLNIAVVYTILFKSTDNFQHCSNANLVITAQRSGAVAVQYTILTNYLSTSGGSNAIHMCFKEKYGSSRNVAFNIRPHITAVTASFFVRLIHFRLNAHGTELTHNKLRYLSFTLAGAGHAHQLDKFVN